MFSNPHQVDFRSLGRRKIALFINVSDTDRSNDKLLNLLYSQALHELCDSADCSPDGRLKVPVRFIMDDFAANAVIPDFDKVISVIRSREIYVSLILQSLSQLDSMYGKDRAMTIINNCDSICCKTCDHQGCTCTQIRCTYSRTCKLLHTINNC